MKFRSLIAVEAHLAELDEDAPLSKTLEGIMENRPIAQAFRLENHKVSSIHSFEMIGHIFPESNLSNYYLYFPS